MSITARPGEMPPKALEKKLRDYFTEPRRVMERFGSDQVGLASTVLRSGDALISGDLRVVHLIPSPVWIEVVTWSAVRSKRTPVQQAEGKRRRSAQLYIHNC